MVKKKFKIPGHKKKEIEGFEELMEGFLEEQEEAFYKKQLADDKNYESYKTYNHLELERERVQKLSSMISRKIPNVIEHNQSTELIEKFTVYNYNLKEEIITDVKRFDSIFFKNIRLLFNKSFREK
jgi:hypothetical protein